MGSPLPLDGRVPIHPGGPAILPSDDAEPTKFIARDDVHAATWALLWNENPEEDRQVTPL